MSKGFVATSRRRPRKVMEAMKKNSQLPPMELLFGGYGGG